ncbi:MAG: NAD(P)H-dependent oxidoreductase [Mogibacterium diversum]|nr:NAD(P)H-dependent oxidoreductase [Mogibacterium diversum]MBF1359862.1 NAD(P)H-dependent oxidoreductase [Mogibacterium diversum]
MKLTIVNGSPRHGKSNSGLLVELLLPFIQEKNEVNITHVGNYKSVDKYIDEIVKADMLVFAFPLYVDSIPSHILYLMERISENHRNNNLIIYVIMNNGFYEGKQNHIAIQQMKLWCCDNGFVWGRE